MKLLKISNLVAVLFAMCLAVIANGAMAKNSGKGKGNSAKHSERSAKHSGRSAKSCKSNKKSHKKSHKKKRGKGHRNDDCGGTPPPPPPVPVCIGFSDFVNEGFVAAGADPYSGLAITEFWEFSASSCDETGEAGDLTFEKLSLQSSDYGGLATLYCNLIPSKLALPLSPDVNGNTFSYPVSVVVECSENPGLND